MKGFRDLTRLYHPITATPFERSAVYTEISPCDALKPYIRCFWGTPEPVISTGHGESNHGIVIPDTCMDIIFDIDYSRNTSSAVFCAIDENSYTTHSADTSVSLSSTFAIRFYAWSAVLFADETFAGSKNAIFDPDAFFPRLRAELLPMLYSVTTLSARAEIASRYIWSRLNLARANSDLMNSVADIINIRGRMRISELSAKNAVSGKRLERIFSENIGVSPKTFSSLIRYQMLWQEICSRGPKNILDMVEKYGYTDQAHLLNDFKKRHSMTPSNAIIFSRKFR